MDWHYNIFTVPEGVSDSVTEVKKVPVIMEQEVSSVEIDISSCKHALQQLLLRLDLIPSVAQELVHSGQRSDQDPRLSCASKQEVDT